MFHAHVCHLFLEHADHFHIVLDAADDALLDSVLGMNCCQTDLLIISMVSSGSAIV